MTKQDIEGFLSNPFFVALKPKESDSNHLESILKDTLKASFDANYDTFYKNLLYLYQSKFSKLEYHNYNYDYREVVKQVVINYCLEHDMLKVFCSEEYEKIVDVIKRKQFNSKALGLVYNRIGFFFHRISIVENSLLMILSNDLSRKIYEYDEGYILNEVGALKKIVDKVASGVKIQCYLDFIQRPHYAHLPDELVEYIMTKHNCDLKRDEQTYEVQKKTSAVLSLAIINDESFWNFDHNEKTIFTFISFVYKYNDIKHAEKILDYAFAEACKNEKVKFLYDNKLPLYFCYDLEGQMANRCADFFERKFNSIFEINLSTEEIRGFVFPLYSGFDDYVLEGKNVFESFITNAYKSDASRVSNLFNDLSNVIQDKEKVTSHMSRKELNIHDYLEFELVGWDLVKEKEEYLSKRYDNYESDESVLGRFYYRIYLIKKYAKEQSFECIYEYIYAMLSMIDKKYGTVCSYALDTTFRDNCYKQLKKILAKHNIIIDDKFKELYIISLLDRKYATPNEANMFAELEQFGDAIYELAVDNIIFYNPNQEKELSHESREKYVNAEAQILVSKKYGFDKLYISKLNDSFNNKYINHEDIEAGLESHREGHYIADSLEMIIGVIAKEFGIQKALDLATDMIVDTFDDLHKPVFVENFDIVDLYNSNYDRDYLDKIYPSPFSREESDYWNDYLTLSYALNKILKIAIIGNDTKEKRRMIANNLDKVMPNDGYDNYYQYVVAYLYNGIEATIEKYRPIVESNYSNYKEN